MKAIPLFSLELRRLLLSRLTWLIALLTLLSPLAGLTLYKPASAGTMLSMYLANPALAGGAAGGVLFGLLAVFELDRANRCRVDVLVDAGVRSVVPVDESVASAIGAGMRIDQPYGRMNIDIGGGRTNVSVFSFGHQIVWDILNVGGDRFDDAIIDYLRKKHNLLIGARTAEELKIDIGSARMRGVKLEMDACGRSLVSGLPRAVTVSSEEMIEALDEPLRDLMSALHRMIERTPPELASDIFDEGITLSGGGAQLFGLDGVISDQLKIRTTLADEPDLCVAHGLSELIDDEERYENIDLVSGSRSDLLGDD